MSWIEQDNNAAAKDYEDKVVGWLNDQPRVIAYAYPPKPSDPDAQKEVQTILDGIYRILRNDLYGYNYTRNIPDIFLSVDDHMVFADAKKSHNAFTNNHLVDEVALEGYKRWSLVFERPVLLAFWHTDGRTGWTTVKDFDSRKSRWSPTEPERNSDSPYWLASCHCRSFDAVIAEIGLDVRDAA